ncbi:MAG: hypothetical protein WC003_08845 [Terrimicrobiaceae bacterium]
MKAEDDFELPVFDRPMDETPSPMTYEQAMAAFEEIIQSRRLREEEPLQREVIPEFRM